MASSSSARLVKPGSLSRGKEYVSYTSSAFSVTVSSDGLFAAGTESQDCHQGLQLLRRPREPLPQWDKKLAMEYEISLPV